MDNTILIISVLVVLILLLVALIVFAGDFYGLGR
jgi:hypothetical protein